jgi:3-oxoacyl-[acyl-carrier protein] reductase
MNYALVSGGSRGIGRAICVKLAQQGFHVIINYNNNREAAMETQQLVEEVGGSAELLPFDVADEEQVNAALDRWGAQHPDEYISVLVNNAGIRRDTLMVFMSNDDWNDVLNTNLNGFFFLTRRLVKEMMTHRHGRIINIASLSGIKGQNGQLNYSAAKAALIGATKALAQEVGSRKITVNAVAPGFIATDMTKELDEASLKKLIPAGRFGTPEEVAAVAAFLASDDAAYINGEVISVNGGLYT